MRMREKLTEYSFEVKWVEGKSHYTADALSRAPVFDPHEEELTVDCAINCLRVTDSKAINQHPRRNSRRGVQAANRLHNQRQGAERPAAGPPGEEI